jgi:hypothetical protein
VACQHLNASECVTTSSTSIPVKGDAGHGEQGQVNPVDFPAPVLGNLRVGNHIFYRPADGDQDRNDRRKLGFANAHD